MNNIDRATLKHTLAQNNKAQRSYDKMAAKNLRKAERPQHYTDLAAIYCGAIAAVILLVVIGLAMWQHFADPDPYTTKIVAECRAGGGIPHVERAGDGKVLGVRCDR